MYFLQHAQGYFFCTLVDDVLGITFSFKAKNVSYHQIS